MLFAFRKSTNKGDKKFVFKKIFHNNYYQKLPETCTIQTEVPVDLFIHFTLWIKNQM